MSGDKENCNIANQEWPTPTGAAAYLSFVDLAQWVLLWPHVDRSSYGGIGKHYFDPRTGEPLDEDEMTFMAVEGPRGTGYIRTYDPPHNQFMEIRVTPLYFQGHNAFATPDLLGLCYSATVDMSSRLDLPLPEATLASLREGDFRLRRVDATSMIDLHSRDAVRSIRQQGPYTRHARLRSDPGLYPNTVLFAGTDYSFKHYDKYEELRDPSKWGHTCASEVREQVHAWTKTMLRAEMTIREKKLVQLGGLNRAGNWTLDTPGQLVREQLGYLRMKWDCDLPPEIVDSLPHAMYQYYYAIKGGANPKKCWGTRDSINKYEALRSELYEIQGQKISVLDLKSMESAPIPDWAIGTEAYFEPGDIEAISPPSLALVSM
jgi:hypothetical protein